ncbi:MAG TPA: glycogen/starch/alpha-glucan phosphorylase, partial [Myxococcales bacterium]|nr:glycogen/starch/alpha-glucan phosphorylase [Myxococcales bacterium]
MATSASHLQHLETPGSPTPAAPAHLGPRQPADARGLFRAFLDHVQYSRGKEGETATTYDRFLALALTVRDRLAERWVRTQRGYYAQDSKRAYYLSAEYLLGRALGNNLIATGLMDAAKEAFREAGVDLHALLEMEPDPGLGNGGLGRLAACFLDSMATLSLPG